MTEQNKQPPAEAGEGAVIYMARNLHSSSYATSRNKSEAELFLHQSGLKNDGVEADVIPLYTSQTAATQAAVAAAKLELAAVIHEVGKDWRSRGSMEKYYAADYLAEYLTSSIPAEATVALESICMEVASKFCDYGIGFTQEQIRAIVTSVIEKGK